MLVCTSPPQLTDAELLQASAGDPDKKITEHLAHCAYCAGRLKQLERSLQGISARVYRGVCPPSMTLSAYHLGELSVEETEKVRAHLAICAECRREVLSFRQFLEATALDEPEEAERIERAGIFGVSFLDASRLSPAAAGLRGSEDAPRIIQVDDFQVTLFVEDNLDRPDLHNLYGLISGAGTAGWTAYLWQAGALEAQTPLSEEGDFSLEGLAQGDYTLILDGPEGEVHIRDVRF